MVNSFQWFTRGEVDLPRLDYEIIQQWIIDVAHAHDRIVGELSYAFCDDPTILAVNRQFLQHDYYTDIITFDNTRGHLLRGDIVISLDTVRSNAALVGATYDSELRRVIIHGVLHLIGINDKGPGEREIMEAEEDAALARLKELERDA